MCLRRWGLFGLLIPREVARESGMMSPRFLSPCSAPRTSPMPKRAATQGLGDWIASYTRAFAAISGVPRLRVPGIALLQVVAHFVRLDFVLSQDFATVPWASFTRLGCPADGACSTAWAASSRVIHNS
jgi:hypothetical protein